MCAFGNVDLRPATSWCKNFTMTNLNQSRDFAPTGLTQVVTLCKWVVALHSTCGPVTSLSEQVIMQLVKCWCKI